MSFDLPVAYGGGGIDSVRTACLVGEELAWGDSPIGSIVGSASFFADPLAALGTEEQRGRWITALCDRSPDDGARDHRAGRGYGRRRDHDDRDQGRRRLPPQREKTWVSGAPVGGYYLVYATVAPGTRAKGITSFVVEQADEGFTFGDKLLKLGARCYPTAELFFADCFVPDDRRVGEEGQGCSA